MPKTDLDRLGLTHLYEGVRDIDRKLAKTMSGYWISFMQTGDPNGKGLPIWEAYSTGKKAYMDFDHGAQPSHNLLPGSWNIFEKIDRRRREKHIYGRWDIGFKSYTEKEVTE